jgi:acetyltransferase
MVDGIRGASILRGHRGRPGVDLACVAQTIARLAALVHTFPQIREMDINPLMGSGQELYVVDARILTSAR